MIPHLTPKGRIYLDQQEKIRLESRNGVIQARYVIYTAQEWKPDQRITPELLKKLQELAINQLYRCAGHFRDGPVTLTGSAHQPPPDDQVENLVDQMCGYVNDNWEASTPGHLSAYLMWRMNWIHPFYGGNGRTSRAISYLALCARWGFVLPGAKTIPDLICNDRTPYFAALRAADQAWANGVVDVSAMETLISDLLAEQLVTIHEQVTGKKLSEPPGNNGVTA